ncbi:MAG: S1 RNA-binding domain-containing protein [Pirellulales bacterium]|nr:S1 RNA-binding domain-containing protein [Pirellulales bacterium]
MPQPDDQADTSLREQAPDENVESPGGDSPEKKRRILIGSQRDPAAYRARRKRDWIPVVSEEDRQPDAETPPPADDPAPAEAEKEPPSQKTPTAGILSEVLLRELVDEPTPLPTIPEAATTSSAAPGHFPPPNIRERLSPDLEAEFEQALGGAAVEELMAGSGDLADQEPLEPVSKHQARIIAVRRDDVFVELGSREQGVISLQQFPEPPQVGATLPVIVQRFNADEGLYELTLPGSAVSVEDWSDLRVDAVVVARVTGHNTGGLECQVNNIRGFIPVSQVALYRVEGLEEFVGQSFPCVVAEADPQRRNLVLSRRAVLEREREEAREKMLASLQPGQILEGTVRKLMNFGAFVELGDGVDGLVHVSQLGWGRVNHPRDVLQEGQKVKVRIDKIDPETRKISLSYKDLLENPWQRVQEKYPPNSIVHGRVVKIMDFGAFVELEPGIEGLIHVSQLSHKRVWRVADVVKEGEELDVMVLSIDAENQRISLSTKALTQPEPPKKKEGDETSPEPESTAETPKKTKPGKEKPLLGGLGKTKGQRFEAKW